MTKEKKNLLFSLSLLSAHFLSYRKTHDERTQCSDIIHFTDYTRERVNS